MKAIPIVPQSVRESALEWTGTHGISSGFRARIRDHIARTEGTDRRLAVVVMRIRRFQEMCVEYSRSSIDDMLYDFETRLRRCLSDGSVTSDFRTGTFCMLLCGNAGSEDFEESIGRMRTICDAALLARNHMFRPRTVAGVSTYPGDSEDADELIELANLARCFAPAGAGCQVARYESFMSEELSARVQMEFALQASLSDQNLDVHYQPIVHLQGEPFVHFEALARWDHPGMGPIEPDRFIAVAEDSGLITRLGDWIFQEAIRGLRTLRRNVGNDVRLALNISGRQIQTERLDCLIERNLENTGRTPHDLIIELTESSLIGLGDEGITGFRRAREMGALIAIDDFGKGYSSLDRISEIPCDYVKIDRGLLQPGSCGIIDVRLFKEVVSFAHALGLDVVAEGVETTGQMQLVMAAECDAAQGFLLSPARPVHDFESTGDSLGVLDSVMLA